MNIDEVKSRIKAAPKAVLFPAALLIVVVVIALARVIAGGSSHQAPVTRPAPAVASTAAQPPAPASTTAQQQPAVAAVAAPTHDAPANAVMQDPLAPPLTPPPGLAADRATYTMETAPEIPLLSQERELKWTELGHKVVASPAVAFETLQEPSFATLMPSTGFVRESWSFWVDVPRDGDWTIVNKLGGNYAKGSVQVDDRAVAALAVETGNDVRTAVASARLAKGWHKIAVSTEQRIRAYKSEMHGTVDLFWRGPGDSEPVAIQPHAVDSNVTPARSAESASSASTTAPVAPASVGGEQ